MDFNGIEYAHRDEARRAWAAEQVMRYGTNSNIDNAIEAAGKLEDFIKNGRGEKSNED